MSLEDLQELQKKVAKEIDAYKVKRLNEARDAYAALIEEYGFTLNEIIGKKPKKPSRKAPAKYCNPKDPLGTWSGHGRRPTWLKNAIARGADIDTFLIT
jgi:DNA-binding protein H-NS